MNNTHTHREAWLLDLIERMRPLFSLHDHELPDKIRVTCGFPSRRPLNGVKNQCVGQVWEATSSKDAHYEVMVSPILDDTMRVAATVAHELVHVAVGLEHDHKTPFKRLAKAIGLEGKMTATQAGPEFIEWVLPVLEGVGPYPHAALDARGKSSGPKKQTTRLLKIQCPMCEYSVRITRKWLDEVGPPACPTHTDPLEELGPE